MHTTPSFRLFALYLAISNLATLTLARVGKDASGINCYGKGCGWDCGATSCSQSFANIINGTGDNQVYKDGAYVACFPDEIGDNGLCGIIHGMGSNTTPGSNMKLVAQDLANHCGECGQAPINRNDGNQLQGGWFQIEAVSSSAICQDASNTGSLALCTQP